HELDRAGVRVLPGSLLPLRQGKNRQGPVFACGRTPASRIICRVPVNRCRVYDAVLGKTVFVRALTVRNLSGAGWWARGAPSGGCVGGDRRCSSAPPRRGTAFATDAGWRGW